ncbi:glycosyltransferase [Candidatus Nomurabacteria bacterium]|nr:glycosyltransferase [Candidatus Nomurabacteria bacterium]USN94572.1 MAG: glycosyltransferase [Candidatus Nomurabacteria bacterium]
MKVLMISGDSKVFREDSSTFLRVKEYAKRVDYLEVVCLCSEKKIIEGDGFRITPVSKNLFSPFKIKSLVSSKIDLVTSQDPFFIGVVSLIVSRFLGAKLHTQVHTDVASPFFRKSFFGKIRFFLARKVLEKSNVIRYVSEKTKENIEKVFDVKSIPSDIIPIITENPGLVSQFKDEEFLEFTKKFQKTILLSGRFEKEKGIYEGVKIFVKDNLENSGLVVVGDGSMKGAILNIIKSDSKNRVLVRPWAFDLGFYMRNVDVFWNNSFFEGFGMAIVESLQNGTPVITSRVGIADKVIDDRVNGLLYDAGDHAAIRNILKEIDKSDILHTLKVGVKNRSYNFYENQGEYYDRIVSNWKKAI